ncbi:IS21 family transposase [Segnochrobactrum spirostomi]|uniref:IS21 family transposase n=1 Tax=Segnochrobactrum spirostomi TaxID=2608987 RepID=A0A6A7Y5X2_9HYPH|nr:IS21 family transposase [Segnochrobactrum spirostomi]MQT13082.1 IS21 family transposase [Segnochrobactrum spirostomi]
MIKLGELMMILDLHRQGLSVSAIARQTGTDRKYIERGLEAPAYGPRKPRQTVLDPFTAYLRERVAAYPGLTGQRLFREIKERGYDGGYTAVTDFLRDVRPPVSPGYEVRFETAPGEQAQVDFAQFHVVFEDEPETPRVVWLFSLVLGFSRLIFARFVHRQDLPTVLRCHIAAFEAIGGVPQEILYDRMKTAVTGADEAEGIVYNRSLVDLARHYGFHPRACRPYRAKTKGKVERPFRYIREDFFLARSFRNLDDLNGQLRHWLDTVANPRRHATTQRVVNEAFAEERPQLQPLPLAPFRSVLRLERRISREGMINVAGNAYSVPDATRRRAVEVHALADEIRIFEDGTLIAVHPVLEGRTQRRVEPGHRRTPERSRPRGGAPSTPVPSARGDRVAQRPLAFYDAVGRALAREGRS